MSHNIIPMKTVGILGGMSNVATVTYYKGINQRVNELLGGFNGAEILMHSVNFANIEAFIRAEQWDAAADYLVDKAVKLERAGADFILCMSNTMHRVAPSIEAAVNIPFLHIADSTAKAIKKANLDTVGLLGTLPVMKAAYMRDYYAERGIRVVIPEASDMTLVDRIIFDELTKDIFKDSSRRDYVRISKALEAAGAQGIILGCTEIELLLKPEHLPSPPFFDTAALHIESAANMAAG